MPPPREPTCLRLILGFVLRLDPRSFGFDPEDADELAAWAAVCTAAETPGNTSENHRLLVAFASLFGCSISFVGHTPSDDSDRILPNDDIVNALAFLFLSDESLAAFSSFLSARVVPSAAGFEKYYASRPISFLLSRRLFGSELPQELIPITVAHLQDGAGMGAHFRAVRPLSTPPSTDARFLLSDRPPDRRLIDSLRSGSLAILRACDFAPDYPAPPPVPDATADAVVDLSEDASSSNATVAPDATAAMPSTSGSNADDNSDTSGSSTADNSDTTAPTTTTSNADASALAAPVATPAATTMASAAPAVTSSASDAATVPTPPAPDGRGADHSTTAAITTASIADASALAAPVDATTMVSAAAAAPVTGSASDAAPITTAASTAPAPSRRRSERSKGLPGTHSSSSSN